MKTPRRGFLKTLAAAPLAPAALSPPATAPPPPTAGEGVAEALAEAVRREFGDHLDATELERVRKELAGGLERAARLRHSARLVNGDGPVNRFEARPPTPPGRGERR